MSGHVSQANVVLTLYSVRVRRTRGLVTTTVDAIHDLYVLSQRVQDGRRRTVSTEPRGTDPVHGQVNVYLRLRLFFLQPKVTRLHEPTPSTVTFTYRLISYFPEPCNQVRNLILLSLINRLPKVTRVSTWKRVFLVFLDSGRRRHRDDRVIASTRGVVTTFSTTVRRAMTHSSVPNPSPVPDPTPILDVLLVNGPGPTMDASDRPLFNDDTTRVTSRPTHCAAVVPLSDHSPSFDHRLVDSPVDDLLDGSVTIRLPDRDTKGVKLRGKLTQDGEPYV